jgi:hypothetical protein
MPRWASEVCEGISIPAQRAYSCENLFGPLHPAGILVAMSPSHSMQEAVPVRPGLPGGPPHR